MRRFDANQASLDRDGVSRRDFLRAGTVGAGALGLSLAESGAAPAGDDVRLIFLCLVGGPGQLDTWDPKPDAPAAVRGPFRPIRTRVPGVTLSELFPRMANQADQYAIVRSVHHEAAPIHETGQQLLQTGRLGRDGVDHPHVGAVVSHLRGPVGDGVPPFVVLPGPIGNTGVSVSHGQGAGYLGVRHEPFTAARAGSAAPACREAFDLDREDPTLRDRYGRGRFGENCLRARRLVERGVRCVTVNMYDTVFGEPTWDCHADSHALPATLDDYRASVCPKFDQAFTALLADLHLRGLLGRTLVVAGGEFGRTPHLNSRGGRDHWPGVWSMLFAGGGIRGGQVVGSSDRLGGEPRDRPATAADVTATIYHALGIDRSTPLPGPDGQPLPVADGTVIRELFRG